MLRYSGHLIPYVIDGEEVVTGLLILVQINSPEAPRIVTILTEIYITSHLEFLFSFKYDTITIKSSNVL